MTGVAVVLPGLPQDLAAPRIVQQASLVVGNNTATWDATLNVAIPASTVADIYTATLTHSVL